MNSLWPANAHEKQKTKETYEEKKQGGAKGKDILSNINIIIIIIIKRVLGWIV